MGIQYSSELGKGEGYEKEVGTANSSELGKGEGDEKEVGTAILESG